MSIITISRGTMSGGKILAETLAERLSYRCISREIIIKAAPHVQNINRAILAQSGSL